MSAQDEIYRKPTETRLEAVDRIKARLITNAAPAETEQAVAARLVSERARMKALDERFLGPGDELMVSQALAQRMGWHVGGEDGYEE